MYAAGIGLPAASGLLFPGSDYPIDAAFEADTHLPDFDRESQWVREEAGGWQESKVGVAFRYDTYRRCEG